MENVHNYLRPFVEMLFPKVCVGCGAIGSYICSRCVKKLVLYEKQRCLYCNRASLCGLTHPSCAKPRGVDGAVSAFHYSPLLKKIIKIAKYRLAKDALTELLQISAPILGSLIAPARSPYRARIFVPIPLHWTRHNRRGFNQSELICEVVSAWVPESRTEIALKRVIATHDQARVLRRSERVANVSHVFRTTQPLRERRVFLVDDVITTGSTLKAAALALKQAGATHVYGLSLARG